MSALSVRHLLDLKSLTPGDYEAIFSTAVEFKAVLARPIKKVPSLRDVTVANLFFENSTRTRLSFELAEKRLSADIVSFSSTGSSVAKGETLLDTVNNILAMKVDVVIIRHSASGASHFLNQRVAAQIINAGDGTNEHPTQGLLDCFTLLQHFGSLKGLKVGIVGDILHSRVARSNMQALKRLGAEVMLCGPVALVPRLFEEFGVKITYDLDELLQWADAVNVLRIQLERQSIRYISSLHDYSVCYGINAERLAKVKRPITILHPGPINRGVELSSEVADSDAALILDQVENGVAIRMAVLYLLAGRVS